MKRTHIALMLAGSLLIGGFMAKTGGMPAHPSFKYSRAGHEAEWRYAMPGDPGSADAAPADQPHDMARVNQYQGMYVFTDCTPVASYTVLGTVKPKGRGLMSVGLKSEQYTSIRDGIIKAAKEDYPEADGIILHLQTGGSDASDAIKFLK